MPPAPSPSDSAVVRIGNCRFAGLSSTGWPSDALAEADLIVHALAAHPGTPEPAHHGSVCVWISSAPDRAPAQWDCLTGWMITGMLAPNATTSDGRRIIVEDYRQLVAYAKTHSGSIRDLAATHQALVATATAAQRRVRPYWRVLLRARTLADGAMLPQVDVQIFVE